MFAIKKLLLLTNYLKPYLACFISVSCCSKIFNTPTKDGWNEGVKKWLTSIWKKFGYKFDISLKTFKILRRSIKFSKIQQYLNLPPMFCKKTKKKNNWKQIQNLSFFIISGWFTFRRTLSQFWKSWLLFTERLMLKVYFICHGL